jgi:predicted TIM-barrel fold metal-dependent hydrolase
VIVDGDGNEYFVFDDHTHMGWRPNAPLLAAFGNSFYAAQMIERMDAAGVDMVVAFPLANPHTDYRKENERLIGFMNDHPDRIVTFARIQPLFGEQAAADIEEYVERGIHGLKFHPFMDGGANPVNNRELMFPLMEVAAHHKLPVLIHSGESWNSSPALIGDLAEHFPDVPFIIGHSGLWEFHQEAIVTAKRYENVFLDVAEVGPPGVVTHLVSGVGHERVLYGSDHPMIPFGNELRKVIQYAELNTDEIRAVLGENLARLLGIPLPDPIGLRRVPLSDL